MALSQLGSDIAVKKVIPNLRQGEHVTLLGMTGSGKTVLAQQFLARMSWVLVIDIKHELKWPTFQVTNRLSDVLSLQHPHVIYRPRNASDAGRIISEVFNQRGWTIYIDEVYGLSNRGSSTSYPPAFIAALTRGRSRGITVWSGMQRPRFAPLFCFTEATHFFVFKLSHSQDRQHVSEFTIDELRDFRPDKYEFGYYTRKDHILVASVPLRDIGG